MRLRHLAVVPFALALLVAACGVTSTTGGTGTGTQGTSTASSGTAAGSSTTGAAGSSTTTGSGTSTTSGGSSSTSSVAATPTPTDPCQRVYPTGAPPDGIPVPPNTLVSSEYNGASGEQVNLACTPGASSDSITSYLDNDLAGAGWHRYNSSTDHNDGCMNVRWVKGHIALDWIDISSNLPYWQILTCDRINL